MVLPLDGGVPDYLKSLPNPLKPLAAGPGRRDLAGMELLLNSMSTCVQRHISGLRWETLVPRLGVCVLHETGEPVASVYRPMVCLVLQGAKEVMIGNRLLRYDAASCFIASVDVPARGRVIEASREKPYIVTSLALDFDVLGGLLVDLPVDTLEQRHPRMVQDPVSGFGVAPATEQLLAAWAQFLSLLDTPADIPGLAPAREREVLYRLLQSGHGPMLRQIGRNDSRLSRIRRAIDWIRTYFDRPLRTEELAEIAGMSVPSFHRHFKAATGSSPLQYQKSLRLQAARQILATGNDAARAAFAVGYESASQFSREYTRQFGTPPSRDIISMQGQDYAAAPI